MKITPCILTMNGGSSSIKFSLFETSNVPVQMLKGKIEGVGLSKSLFTVKEACEVNDFTREVTAPDHSAAAGLLMAWLKENMGSTNLVAIGHRVVHGGPKYWQPQRVTPEMIEELRRLSPFDPEHLPEEILLIQACQQQFSHLPQVACFDTAFHHDLPLVARLLAIPRRYEAKGVRRYGFHGLSCTYLMEELERRAGREAAQGRVILAHLGNGASVTAVRSGKSIDTSMGLTPAAGLPMSSRSGDLDPGVASYLARTEKLRAEEFYHMVNAKSGLLGISEISSDMQELLLREAQDARAAEASALFCYQAKKWIGAYTAALGGLGTLIFAGGIGENAASVRARICEGLEFLGIEIDGQRNSEHANVISTEASRATVRVIRTDEEVMIAESVCLLLGFGLKMKEL